MEEAGKVVASVGDETPHRTECIFILFFFVGLNGICARSF